MAYTYTVTKRLTALCSVAIGPSPRSLSSHVTVTYVAPEVVLNKGEDPATREGYNLKVDVWSLGVILYILYGADLCAPRTACHGAPA